MGLNHATQQISDLQRQLAEARAQAPAAGGSFLGAASPWGGGSVPRAGQPIAPAPAYAPPPQGYARNRPMPHRHRPPVPGDNPRRQAPAASGSAATIRGGCRRRGLDRPGPRQLFGGHQFGGGYGGGFGGGMAGGSPWGGAPGGVVGDPTAVNNYYGDQGQDQDPGVQDASYDDQSYDNGDADSTAGRMARRTSDPGLARHMP